MERSGVEQKIRQILQEKNIETSQGNIEVDSLDAVGFVMDLEEEFDMEISNTDIDTYFSPPRSNSQWLLGDPKQQVSVNKIVDYVHEKVESYETA
ncbi:acyl carrier protein [Candidatus Pacearchaeota archaeon]|nr:acyl carrier protein [Candidatus Pacearchaeota archaeon]